MRTEAGMIWIALGLLTFGTVLMPIIGVVFWPGKD